MPASLPWGTCPPRARAAGHSPLCPSFGLLTGHVPAGWSERLDMPPRFHTKGWGEEMGISSATKAGPAPRVDMSSRAGRQGWTCPPLGPAAGHSPNMPTPRTQEWACPQGLEPKGWTSPRGMGRWAGMPHRGAALFPACPRPGHPPATAKPPDKTIRRSAPPRRRPSIDGHWSDVGGPAARNGRGNRSSMGFSCSGILSHT